MQRLSFYLLLSSLIAPMTLAEPFPTAGKLLGPRGGLRNISTNGQVDSTGMLAGFIIEGDARRVVITGEALDGGSLNAALQLTNLDGSQIFDSNNRWRDHPTATELEQELRPLGRDSDAGFVISLSPGAYLARLGPEDGRSDRGLISVTDISAADAPGGLRNISTNGVTDSTGMLAGFIVEGSNRPFAITGEALQGSSLDAALILSSLDGSFTLDSNESWQEHPSAGNLQQALRPLGQASDAGFTILLGPGVYLARLYPEDDLSARGLISVTDLGQPPIALDVDLRPRGIGLEYSPDDGDGELQYRVINRGPATVELTDWTINLVLSPDATIGNGNEIYVFTETAGVVLAADELVERDETNTADFNMFRTTAGAAVPSGEYYLALWVDDRQQILENNEENNALVLDSLIEVP